MHVPLRLLVLFTIFSAFSILSCVPSDVSVRDEKATTKPVAGVRRVAGDTARQVSWADSILASLLLEEKIGQMIVPKSYGHYMSLDGDEYTRLEHLVADRKVGGLAMFQGDIYEEAILLNKLQRVAKIPLLVAGDFERGLAMRVRKGTSFPDAMALGATRSPEYAYRMGQVIGEEARAIGIHQNLAPVADINTNPANPVINTRSYGDNIPLVQQMVTAMVRGARDSRMASTAKHFPGHGDTKTDSHLDLPVLPYSRARLDSVELAPFRAAIDSGVQSVMVAHLAVTAFDSIAGIPASLSAAAITDVLKHEMKFQGLVVTDAMDMQGLVRGFSVGQSSVIAVKAGVDMILVPLNEEVAANALLAAVRGGEIAMDRLDESVRKILALKQWLGLDRERLVDPDLISSHVATRPHWALSKEIAQNAITLLRNERNLLPLRPFDNRRILSVLITDNEDYRTEIDRPGNPLTSEPFGTYFAQQLLRRAGNVETIRLTPESRTPDFDNILKRMNRADLVIVSLFIRVRTASGKLSLSDAMHEFVLRAASPRKRTMVISFGNPYVAADFPRANVLMCTYGDAEVLQEAAVEALFGEINVHGKLPVSIPGKFPFGSGLELQQNRLRKDEPAVVGFDPKKLQHLDEIVQSAIRDSAFPGAQLAVLKGGVLVYNKSFGTHTYETGSREVDGSTLYDLASLTKVIATTPAIMKLYDEKRLDLDDPAGKFLPQFTVGDKAPITIRHLLLHRSGFPPFRRLWEFSRSPGEALDSVFATPLVARPGDTTIYSDLGMMTLGKVAEEVSGMSLSAFVAKEFFEPLGMNNTMFNPPSGLRSRVAPTELDTIWRKTLVHGSVHDENAALVGGVSGHAGLFSTASDLAIFMQMILDKGTYNGVRYLNEATVQEFTQNKSPGQERWLGWDMISEAGSSAGDLFSSASFGHTGFTGTSIWADPQRNLAVIFLTNRLYPSRSNTKILRVRPMLHDAVIRALGGRR